MKKEILRLLRQSEGYVSGQELCNRFGVSRTAVWKVINQLKEAGYEIRQGKNLSFWAPEQKNFTYMKSLGSYHTEENVRLRLEKNRYKTKTPKHLSREARLYINISTYVTTGNREGFE